MLQSSLPNASGSSYHIFSIYTKLIDLFNQQLSSKSASLTMKQEIIKQLEQDFSKSFISPSSSKYQQLLFNFFKSITMLASPASITQPHSISSQNPHLVPIRSFLQHYSETKTRILNLQNIIQNIGQIKILVAEKSKFCNIKQQLMKKNAKQGKLKDKSKTNVNNNSNSQNFKKQNFKTQQQITYKSYVIYGKAINAERHKKSGFSASNNIIPAFSNENNTTKQSQQYVSSLNFEDKEAKQQLVSQLQYCMTKMYEQHKLPYIKSQPHDLQDLILSHQIEDQNILPVMVSNQIYKSFVPVDFAVVIVIPQQLIQSGKPQIPFLFKDTLLNFYIENFRCLSKTISRQTYYKNNTFRGIIFVEQGQVQTKGGRIVARGWVISGKCKATTTVWRFVKVMTFFKYILQNQNMWKQFTNDIKLNCQWPIKISDVLNFDQKLLEQILGQEGGLAAFNNKNGKNKRFKFPPISGRFNKSFDIHKLCQIQKLKHFNEKMNHLYEYKQEMLKRKMEAYSLKKSSLYFENQVNSQQSQKQMNKKIKLLSQNLSISQKGLKTDNSRSVILTSGESSANILISGIVRKLKSIHQTSLNSSNPNSSRQQSNKRKAELNRSKTKILGLKRYDQLLKNEKNHRYKGKNMYHL